jgi:hypothetical protein
MRGEREGASPSPSPLIFCPQGTACRRTCFFVAVLDSFGALRLAVCGCNTVLAAPLACGRVLKSNSQIQSKIAFPECGCDCMTEPNFPDDDEIGGAEGEGEAGAPATKAKWQIRFSDTSDSPYATGFMPLSGASGELLWRTPSGKSFVIYDTDSDEPAKTSRMVASLVHRLRGAGHPFEVTTRQAVLWWTEYEQDPTVPKGTRQRVRPRDFSRRVIICDVIRNPVYEEWLKKKEVEDAEAGAPHSTPRPRGRPPKQREGEQPKRPRGRPRKIPLASQSGKHDFE